MCIFVSHDLLLSVYRFDRRIKLYRGNVDHIVASSRHTTDAVESPPSAKNGSGGDMKLLQRLNTMDFVHVSDAEEGWYLICVSC